MESKNTLEIFDLQELFSIYEFNNLEKIRETIAELLSLNEDYEEEHFLSYMKSQMEIIRKEDYNFYKELSGESNICLDTVIDLLLRYNKAVIKLNSLQKMVFNKVEGYSLYPDYLCYECLSVNKEIARLQKMQYTQMPMVINHMKKFDTIFNFKGKKYIVDTPKSFLELIQEGYLMHNCLVMRGPDVATEKIRVIFIKTQDKKSYIDIILDTNFRIIWAIKDNHEKVSGEDLKLVSAWYKKTFRKEIEMVNS